MCRIALTGGIASGKTSVSDELARRGAVIIDSDVLAREVVEPGTPGLREVVDRFGEDVLTADGTLDRPKLGSLVFADDEARADLNAIVHPRVRERARALEDEAGPDDVVVHVIPLLVETGQQDKFARIIVVDVPVETQVERLMSRNDLTHDEAMQRIRSQATRDERLAVATDVIDNSGSTEATFRQVADLWHDLAP